MGIFFSVREAQMRSRVRLSDKEGYERDTIENLFPYLGDKFSIGYKAF